VKQGGDVTMIAGCVNTSVFKLMASKDIKTATDVSVIQARDASGQVSVLTAGQVQAVLVSPPNDLIAQKHGATCLSTSSH
jgi:hypothetical protein